MEHDSARKSLKTARAQAVAALDARSSLRRLRASMPCLKFDSRRRWGAARAALSLVLGWGLLGACGQDDGPATCFDLHQSLAASSRCFVSVPDKAVLEIVRTSFARHPPRTLTFEIAIEGQPLAEFGSQPRIWIGTPTSPGCEAALARLGVERLSEGFRFQGQEFVGRGDGLIATVADPERFGSVLEIVLGNDVRPMLKRVRDWTPTSRMGWQLIRGGAVHREGTVDSSGAVSATGEIDVAAVEAGLTRDGQRAERADFDWIAAQSFDAPAEEAWLASLDRACSGVRQRLGRITPFDAPSRLCVRVFETPDELARVCRARGAAQLRPLEPQAELSIVHVAAWQDNSAFELARATALVSAGEPAAGWLLDGVAAASCDSWFGRSRESWLAYLWTGELVPGVEQLTRDDSQLSPHVARPLRAALLLCCEEGKGADFAARQWAAKPETTVLPSDDEFRAWHALALARELEAARTARVERHRASLALSTRRGACMLPSRPKSDPMSAGFGSRASEKSLAELRKLGASAVALSWCSALEESEPRFFGAGPEIWTQADDAELFATIMRARNLGLDVTLLPQLVATESGGWAGQVLLTTARTQRELFRSWSNFLTHVGLLAELAGVDVLSLGTEAPDSTVTRASNENRRRANDLENLSKDWRFLIQAGRSAFAGGLTYAARWDGEAQGIEFWKDLDFMGQNVFVPFAEAKGEPSPAAAEMTQRIVGSFAHLAQLSKQQGVRPLICGIGISSSAEGWAQPSRPQGGIDLDLQVRFYEALLRALQIGRKQSIAPAGLFTWCWWSDPESGGLQDRGFTPQNKPAEAALGRALHVR